jgi:hypothetical protein
LTAEGTKGSFASLQQYRSDVVALNVALELDEGTGNRSEAASELVLGTGLWTVLMTVRYRVHH